MALARLLAPFFLLSLVVIASANYETYGSTQNPNVDYQKPKLVDQGHNYRDKYDNYQQNGNVVDLPIDSDNINGHYDQQSNGNIVDQVLGHHSNPTKPESSYQKEQYRQPVPQEGYKIPVPEGRENNVVPTDKSYYSQDQKIHDYQVQQGLVPSINVIGMEGNVLCKSDNKYTPIQGAVARITCPRLYDNGYEKSPFSISTTTNERGCFLATLQVSKLVDESVNLKECKAYVEQSPLESCNAPTNYRGSTGAYFTPYHTLADEKYYTVGSFVFMTETHYSVPTNDHAAPGTGY